MAQAEKHDRIAGEYDPWPRVRPEPRILFLDKSEQSPRSDASAGASTAEGERGPVTPATEERPFVDDADGERRPQERGPAAPSADTALEEALKKVAALELANKEKEKAITELQARARPKQMAHDGQSGFAYCVNKMYEPRGMLEVDVYCSRGGGLDGKSKRRGRLPRIDLGAVGGSTWQALVVFLFAVAGGLCKMGVGACVETAAAACTFAKNTLSGAAASAATIAERAGTTIATYADPNPLLSLLHPTSCLVIITSWRPYLDGMTWDAADVAVTAGYVAGLLLPCVAGDDPRAPSLSLPYRLLPYRPPSLSGRLGRPPLRSASPPPSPSACRLHEGLRAPLADGRHNRGHAPGVQSLQPDRHGDERDDF